MDGVLSIFFLSITIINILVYLIVLLNDLNIMIKNNQFKKTYNAGIEMGKKMEKMIMEETSSSKKVGMFIGFVLVSLLLIGVYGAPFYLPVIIGFNYNFINAFLSYIILTLFTSAIRIYQYAKSKNLNPEKLTLMSILTILNFQVILIILHGWNASLNSMILTTYESGAFLSNTFTILLPVFYFSAIILTLYLYYMGLLNNISAIKKAKYQPKLAHLLIILVISSVVGLIYLFEMNLDVSNNSSFNLLLNLIMVVLGSILIPSVFSLTRKSEAQTDKMNRVYRNKLNYRRRRK